MTTRTCIARKRKTSSKKVTLLPRTEEQEEIRGRKKRGRREVI